MGRELELIADAFAEEPLDVEVLLGLINQYYSSLGKPTISNLDDVRLEHATDDLGAILGFQEGNRTQMQDRLVESKIFSNLICDYDNEVQDRIRDNILDSDAVRRESFYIGESLHTISRNGNISLILRRLLQREGIRKLDDINTDIRDRYTGFFKSIWRRPGKGSYTVIPLYYIKSRAIHLGFFADEVEKKYSSTIETGKATELIRKIDCEIFGYADISYTEGQVDSLSFRIFAGIYNRRRQLGVRANCALHLFDYFIRKTKGIV